MFPAGPVKMKVSCLIPTRDRRDMVLKAVASTLAQEGGPPEVIVVDDGSTDGTTEAVRRQYPYVRLVRTGGLGPGLARNAGAAAAEGDVFMFLDSDDLWEPDHIKQLSGLIEQGFSAAYGVARTTDLINGGDFLIPEAAQGPEGQCFPALVRWCFLVPSAFAVTRRAFEAVGGFGPESFGEDWIFFLKLAAGYPFGFTPAVITQRLLHPGSLCCLQNPGVQITALLDRIAAVLEETGRADSTDLARLQMMRRLAAEEGEKWRTIQDWYLTLKGRGLV